MMQNEEVTGMGKSPDSWSTDELCDLVVAKVDDSEQIISALQENKIYLTDFFNFGNWGSEGTVSSNGWQTGVIDNIKKPD